MELSLNILHSNSYSTFLPFFYPLLNLSDGRPRGEFPPFELFNEADDAGLGRGGQAGEGEEGRGRREERRTPRAPAFWNRHASPQVEPAAGLDWDEIFHFSTNEIRGFSKGRPFVGSRLESEKTKNGPPKARTVRFFSTQPIARKRPTDAPGSHRHLSIESLKSFGAAFGGKSGGLAASGRVVWSAHSVAGRGKTRVSFNVLISSIPPLLPPPNSSTCFLLRHLIITSSISLGVPTRHSFG